LRLWRRISTSVRGGFLLRARRGRRAVAASWRFRRRPGLRAARSAEVWLSCVVGSRHRRVVFAVRAVGASRKSRPNRVCWRRCPVWCSRRSVAIPKRRCCGSARASVILPAHWPSAASPPVKNWSADCCVVSASACRPTARPAKARATPTAMRSLTTSTHRSKRSRQPDSRPSRSTPRRRNWLRLQEWRARVAPQRRSRTRSGA
jgi:hypothetical protein